MNLPGTSELALSLLIGCTVKATLLLVLAGFAAYALRGRSAALRHHVWALGIVSSMGLPLLTILLPSWHSKTLSTAARIWVPAHSAAYKTTFLDLPSMVVDAVAGSSFSERLVNSILLLWAFGALFVMLRLLVGWARLAWMSAHARPVVGDDWAQTVLGMSNPLGIARQIQLLQAIDAPCMPMTWGIVPPWVLFRQAQQNGPRSAGEPFFPMSSRTSRVTTGWRRYAASWFVDSIGSIRSFGSRPRGFGLRANAPATTPF